MHHSMHSNHHNRVDKGHYHPDINPLDVVSGWQRVEHINEERGKGHENSCIDTDNTFKHVTNKVVGQLINQN